MVLKRLLRPAIAAYEHARRLDPQIRTAVSHAYLMTGEYERNVPDYAEYIARPLPDRGGGSA